MKKNKYIYVLSFLVLSFACNEETLLPEIVEETEFVEFTNDQDVDFSNFVALGASFTTGFTDNALFIEAQENSYPNIMATIFADIAEGGEFNQPLMNDNIGGLLFSGTQIQNPRLFFDGFGPVTLPATPTTEVTDKFTGANNNFGTPGAKIYHLLADGYGSVAGVPLELSNPYYARFSSSETSSIISDVVSAQPTFFTMIDAGGNDVLGYALAGGGFFNGEQAVNQEGNFDPSAYGTWDITDSNVFANAFGSVVTALTSTGAKGIIGNVPYITSLAHFTTVPYNAVPLDEATATLLNSGYDTYNGGLQAAAAALAGTGLFTDEELAARTISFAAGDNAVVIEDESLTDLGAIDPAFAGLPKYRQATANDLLVLTSSSFIGTLVNDNPTLINGLSVPLADNWVLTPEEQAEITNAIDTFNASIETIASANSNVVMIDVNGILQEAATSGLPFDDFTLTTDLVTGGLIGLDGVHLTSRGYALLANKILETIDEGFGTNFGEATNGLAKADDFPTNYSPTLE